MHIRDRHGAPFGGTCAADDGEHERHRPNDEHAVDVLGHGGALLPHEEHGHGVQVESEAGEVHGGACEAAVAAHEEGSQAPE